MIVAAKQVHELQLVARLDAREQLHALHRVLPLAVIQLVKFQSRVCLPRSRSLDRTWCHRTCLSRANVVEQANLRANALRRVLVIPSHHDDADARHAARIQRRLHFLARRVDDAHESHERHSRLVARGERALSIRQRLERKADASQRMAAPVLRKFGAHLRLGRLRERNGCAVVVAEHVRAAVEHVLRRALGEHNLLALARAQNAHDLSVAGEVHRGDAVELRAPVRRAVRCALLL
mmetsp:Transcript_16987/g.43418  ORF Transcript_16987/g.43418 Transcript_16987/m.43418 type:complete len:236 (-) Transcript_16987:466-1173(-)